MKFVNKRCYGFSLIEVLIVVAIIGTATTLSWMGVSNAKKQMLVDNACDGVAIMSNKARAYALSGMDNANSVRVHCTETACQIQSNPNDVWTNIESSYVLQGAKFTTAFEIVYSIPYATGNGIEETHAVELVGNTAFTKFTKNLTTNNFKATCQ